MALTLLSAVSAIYPRNSYTRTLKRLIDGDSGIFSGGVGVRCDGGGGGVPINLPAGVNNGRN